MIRTAEAAGAEVVIIDSFSHEYDGEGGIMDWADELAEKGTKSPGNWKEPKLAHKKMMNALLQCRASLIFCLRADEKISIEKKEVEDRGRTVMKTVITPLGWVPICEKRFMYEMTASFTLTPERPGRPRFDLPHKLQSQHRHIFTENEPISEEAGQMLAEWARGGAPVSSRPETLTPSGPTAAPVPASSQTGMGADFPGDEPPLDPRVEAIIDDARSKADEGIAAYQEYFGGLPKETKAALVGSGQHDKLKARAARKATA